MPFVPILPNCQGCIRQAGAVSVRMQAQSSCDRRAALLAVALLPGAQILETTVPLQAYAVASNASESPAARENTFVSRESGFAFTYPDPWVVGIDRSSMQVPGTLLVAGDFPNNVTVSVSRVRLAELGLASLKPSDLTAPQRQEDLLSGTVQQLAAQEGLFQFKVLSSAFRTSRDAAGMYLDLEFEVSTCRGEIMEGLRGRRRCVDPADNSIPTPVKHIYQTSFLTADGYVLSAAAGTVAARWPAAEKQLVAAARSFTVA